jgi:hypothetical protein
VAAGPLFGANFRVDERAEAVAGPPGARAVRTGSRPTSWHRQRRRDRLGYRCIRTGIRSWDDRAAKRAPYHSSPRDHRIMRPNAGCPRFTRTVSWSRMAACCPMESMCPIHTGVQRRTSIASAKSLRRVGVNPGGVLAHPQKCAQWRARRSRPARIVHEAQLTAKRCWTQIMVPTAYDSRHRSCFRRDLGSRCDIVVAALAALRKRP